MFQSLKTPLMSLILVSVLSTLFAAEPLTDEAKKEVVNTMANQFKRLYVFEDLGVNAGNLIRRKMNEGAYGSIKNPDDFAEALTDDLLSITNDKHIRVRHQPPVEEGDVPQDPLITAVQRNARYRAYNYGFTEVSVKEGNVGYIDLRGFSSRANMAPIATQAMGLLARVDALVLDLRNNGGGDPEAVKYLCSYFFKPGVHLNSLYHRITDVTTDYFTLDEVPGKRLLDVPIVVLTSGNTFSAGEECAYNLRTRKRATLVGEVTGGGANPGRMVPVGSDFGVFIPTGRAINPITKTNWEGVGVKPHIETSADEAYDVGMKKAREAAEAHLKSRLARSEAEISELNTAIEIAKNQFADNAGDRAQASLEKAMNTALEAGLLDRSLINQIGYRYVGQGDLALAEALMRFNTKKFPDSPNTYDSLGEVLEKMERLNEAKANYAEAVKLGRESKHSSLPYYIANLKRVTQLLD